MAETPQDRDKRPRALQLVAATAVGVLLGGGTVAFFTVRICDQQLSARGAPIRICRHMQATDPPVIILTLVVLVGLSVFFTEISGFGITLKRQIREATENARHARDVAVATQAGVEDVAEQARDVGRAVVEVRQRPEIGEVEPSERPPEDPITQLVNRYNDIRLTERSSTQRTRALENIFLRMARVLEDVEEFEVKDHLSSKDGGLRLAGYAYLYGRPEPDLTQDLVDSVIETEDTAFGSYWGLKALRKQCEKDPGALTASSRARLREAFGDLPAATGRGLELRRLLEECSR